MQRNQDIKGFTILELLVVVVLVAIISGVAYPNFSSWKVEREVRAATEKISNMISNVSIQTQRGTFAYSQFWIVPIQKQKSGKTITYPVFFSKGMKKDNFTSIINAGTKPGCSQVQKGYWDDLGQTTKIGGTTYSHFYEVYDPEEGIDEIEIGTHINLQSAICFGMNGNYYKAVGNLAKTTNRNIRVEDADTINYIIICTQKNAQSNGNKCPDTKGKLEKPAYLVKWSRFGNVSKFKWNGSAWNRQ